MFSKSTINKAAKIKVMNKNITKRILIFIEAITLIFHHKHHMPKSHIDIITNTLMLAFILHLF